MKSAANNIALGLVLSSISFSISEVPLFNVFLGLILILSGVKYAAKAEENYQSKVCFKKCYKICIALIVITLVGYVMSFKSANVGIIKDGVISSIDKIANMFFCYYLIKAMIIRSKFNFQIKESYELKWKWIFVMYALSLVYTAFYINIHDTNIDEIAIAVIFTGLVIVKLWLAIGIKRDLAVTEEVKELNDEK